VPMPPIECPVCGWASPWSDPLCSRLDDDVVPREIRCEGKCGRPFRAQLLAFEVARMVRQARSLGMLQEVPVDLPEAPKLAPAGGVRT
jgi:hypothetical protein